jgi:hypothetical protein
MRTSNLPPAALSGQFAAAPPASRSKGPLGSPRVLRSGLVKVCATSLGLLFAGTAFAVPFSLKSSGTFSDSWQFPSGALPTAPGAVKTYTANAIAGASADGSTGPSFGKPVTGTKLTYTSAGTSSGLPSGTFTPGSVTATDAVAGTLGSVSFGTISISGAKTGIGTNTATVGGSATVKPAAKAGAAASFFATAKDPFPFQMQDLSTIPLGTTIDFSLSLAASDNDLRAGDPSNTWNVTYKSFIKDIDTSDVDTFYAADPPLLYSLSLSGGPSGFAVDFEPGSPSGFPVTFSETKSEIDANMLAALEAGWTGSFAAVSGTIDVGGHVSATIGAEGDIEQAAVGVPIPEPASFWLIAVGLAGIGLAGRKASKQA